MSKKIVDYAPDPVKTLTKALRYQKLKCMLKLINKELQALWILFCVFKHHIEPFTNNLNNFLKLLF